jgi:hypothetical protein
MIFLVWVGFTELYSGSSTFGAGGAKEYLEIFLWGFGAEAIGFAVSDLVKGLAPAA